MAHYHSNYARLLCSRGDYEHAIELAREAVRLDPALSHGFEILAWAEMEMAHWESARVHCLESLRLDPLSAWGHNNMGIWYQAHGQAEQAYREFAEALRLKPDMHEAQENAIRSLQARHPLFALAWRWSSALLHLPSRWRQFAIYACLLVVWAIGQIIGWAVGGERGAEMGALITLLLLTLLAFVLLGQQIFVWLVRKGIIR